MEIIIAYIVLVLIVGKLQNSLGDLLPLLVLSGVFYLIEPWTACIPFGIVLACKTHKHFYPAQYE